MIRYLIVFLLIVVPITARDKFIPNIIYQAILNNECLKIKNKYYPYVIRINSEDDIQKVEKEGYKIIKNKLILCNNSSECANITQELIDLGIKNLDLGPYQINYYYHGHRWNGLVGYFNFDEAKKRAGEILYGLIESYGYSWETIARYHYYDPDDKTRNTNYYTKLYKFIYNIK